MKVFERTIDEIKGMRIRGANAIAESGLKALSHEVERISAKNKADLIERALYLGRILSEARPTEPLLRNAIKCCISAIQRSDAVNMKNLKATFSLSAKKFLQDMKNAEKEIAKIGAKRIKEGATILTHCHSSTVVSLLKAAKGKRIAAICTETRPLYQGRITARELIRAGIKTRMIIDSAVRFFIKGVDLVLVGADAITSEGNVINKIGTSQIALAANEARIPFYVASTVYKFSPETALGKLERIEERNPKEVWENFPKKLKILNPAFDITPREYIDGIICEYGLIPPFQVPSLVMEKHPWMMMEL